MVWALFSRVDASPDAFMCARQPTRAFAATPATCSARACCWRRPAPAAHNPGILNLYTPEGQVVWGSYFSVIPVTVTKGAAIMPTLLIVKVSRTRRPFLLSVPPLLLEYEDCFDWS